MSIAEQMGRTLQRTSISTNIKERLDLSCALFGPDGGLVSNAPHVPVNLGTMQDTVRHQMNFLGSNLKRGDVILADHPKLKQTAEEKEDAIKIRSQVTELTTRWENVRDLSKNKTNRMEDALKQAE